MIRAALYLVAAGAVWLAEGYIFSTFLHFNAWQTALLFAVYLVLWLAACARLLALMRGQRERDDSLPIWRYLSLAPMLAAILGSFASLPILIAIAALGRLV